MRRTLATSLVAMSMALGMALTVTPAVVSAASGGASSRASREARAATTLTDRERAAKALATAKALFDGRTAARSADRSGQGRATTRPADATVALRDLFASRGSLTPAERKVAGGILARPTDGIHDPYGYGYTVPAVKKCDGHFCLHWVNSTADAPPSRAWVRKMLKLLNHVWTKEVNKLGYRPPIPDRGRGGNDKFDVYLKEIGSVGLYGFCAPERRKPGFQWLASAFCVIDNDFVGFPRPPMQSAEVTAAHEFFHAIQFGYDYGEDPWLLEATATWMEERVYDGVNDNRQYLPAGQVAVPLVPLDYFGQGSSEQYGNWSFFEYLSKKFGNRIVQNIWNKAAAFPGAPDLYSTKAISAALQSRSGFKKIYAAFVSANLLPAKFYPEGKSWVPYLPADRFSSVTLSRAQRRTGKLGTSLLHMSSASWEVKSSSSLRSKKWYLKVKVDGPKPRRMPAAYVLIAKRRGFDKRFVQLNGRGHGQVIVPFSRRKVKAVYVSLVNASTRFRCGKRTQFSCSGLPIDDGRSYRGQPYHFSATVIKR